MPNPDKALTKEWFMVMLYDEPQSLDKLTDVGCERMFFGWEWEQLESILDEMERTKFVTRQGPSWILQPKGKFYIKKKTLLPILKISANPELLASFKEFAKDKCDTDFLVWVGNQKTEHLKINRLKQHAQQNYDKIAITATVIAKFLLTGN